MHKPTATPAATATSRAPVVDPPTAARHGLLRRLDREDSGAELAEYAMLGGVSAVACGGLALLIESGLLNPIFEAVINGVTATIAGWF